MRDGCWVLLAALTMLMPVTVSADPTAARSRTYRACVARSGGQQAAYRACAAEEATRADRALNAAYVRRTQALLPAARSRLQRDERDWIARRETDCRAKYRNELQGQDAGAVYQLCMADAAIARTAALSGR